MKAIRFALILVALLDVSAVLACSCLGPITLFKALQDKSSTAVKILIRNEIFPTGALDENGNGFRYFRAQVQRAYRGCKLMGQPYILVKTAGNSAACGVDIIPRTEYIMFGSLQRESVEGYGTRRVLSVGLCGFFSPFEQLTESQRKELASRRYEDNCPPKLCDDSDKCGPRPPVAPPIVCPDGSSTFYDIQCIDVGYRCQWDVKASSCPACAEDSDCFFTSYCDQGRCRTKGTCDSNVDCWNPSNSNGDVAAEETELPCLAEKRECNGSICESKCCTDAIFACFVDPCDTVNVPYFQCTSDFCGGCNAYAFDRAGNQVN
jgi:hypothetical protein